MKHVLNILGLFLLLGFSYTRAQESYPLPLDTAVRYGKLENGLTYYIRHNEQPKERAEFFIAQQVGAILEADDQDGLAHFLEHMAFNGTSHFPGKKLIEYFESIGVKFGTNINAYTSLDETVYNLSAIPTTREGIIDSALLALYDWSHCISLENDEIDKERGVIREEWRQGQNADRRIWKEANKRLFAGSPYARRDVIGDTSVINHFSYTALKDYYKKWYRPDLQAILIVGDIDVAQIEQKIKTLFSTIPAPVDPAERLYFPIPDSDKPITGVFTDPEEQSLSVHLYYMFDPLPDSINLSQEGYVTGLIKTLIQFMTNERFGTIAMEPETPFAGLYSALTGLTRTKDVYAFIAEPVSGKDSAARARLLQEVEKIHRYGFTVSELERAKTELLSRIEQGYNERSKRSNNTLVQEYVRHFTQAEPAPGIEWEYRFSSQVLPEITVEMVNQIANELLESPSMAYLILGPQKDGLVYPSDSVLRTELQAVPSLTLEPPKEELSDQPLISVQLKPGKIKEQRFDYSTGTIQWQLSNGIRVLIKPTRFKADEIKMAAWSDGGNSLITPEALPSADYATYVIEESGLGNFSKTDLQKMLAGKQVSVSPIISSYTEGFRGNSSVKDAETMMQLIYLYFTGIRQDNNAYQIFERAMRTRLENAQQDPMNAYYDSINAILYNHHPRVLPNNLETFSRVSQEQIMNVYRERFANSADFTFLFVGNIDLDTFKSLVNTYLGSLKTEKRREKWIDNQLRFAPGQVTRLIEKPLQLKKSTCYIQYAAEMPFDLNHYLSLKALANLLEIRYTETIREEEGGSYGVNVSGQITNRPLSQGVLAMFFETDPAIYQHMVEIIHRELNRVAEQGPDSILLDKVLLNLEKEHQENLEQNGWWLSVLETKYNNGVDLISHFDKALKRTDKAAVQAMANYLLTKNNCIEVILKPNE